MDPTMEQELFHWCIQEVRRIKKPITRSHIKQKARSLSMNKNNFKASKGWLDKFMKRFNFIEICRKILANEEPLIMNVKMENSDDSSKDKHEFWRDDLLPNISANPSKIKEECNNPLSEEEIFLEYDNQKHEKYFN